MDEVKTDIDLLKTRTTNDQNQVKILSRFHLAPET